MSPRLIALTATLLLVGGTVFAATKAQMNVVPTKPDCFVIGSFCLNNGASCFVDNSECANSSMSASSKFKLDSTLVLKGGVKQVKDNSGALITTGAEGAADNLIFKLTLTQCIVDNGPPNCHDVQNIYLKVVLNNGNGTINVNLAPVLGGLASPVTSGDPLMISGGGLLAPASPGFCLGTNSAANISARLNEATCESGGVYGVIGFAAQ